MRRVFRYRCSLPRVLIISENERIARLIYATLSGAAFDVRYTIDLDKGLRLAARDQAQLIVLDVNAPSDELAVAGRQLHGSRVVDAVPILLLANRRADPRDYIDCASCVRAYVQKPFSPKALRHTVEALVRSARRPNPFRRLSVRGQRTNCTRPRHRT